MSLQEKKEGEQIGLLEWMKGKERKEVRKRKKVITQVVCAQVSVYPMFSLSVHATDVSFYFFFANPLCWWNGVSQKPQRLLPTNIYVVLYEFRARHEDELDLK